MMIIYQRFCKQDMINNTFFIYLKQNKKLVIMELEKWNGTPIKMKNK